jgi:hypothetical protein
VAFKALAAQSQVLWDIKDLMETKGTKVATGELKDMCAHNELPVEGVGRDNLKTLLADALYFGIPDAGECDCGVGMVWDEKQLLYACPNLLDWVKCSHTQSADKVEHFIPVLKQRKGKNFIIAALALIGQQGEGHPGFLPLKSAGPDAPLLTFGTSYPSLQSLKDGDYVSKFEFCLSTKYELLHPPDP